MLPIADRHNDARRRGRGALREAGLRAEVDERTESVGRKIRDAELRKIPYMLVVGDREAEDGHGRRAPPRRGRRRAPCRSTDFVERLRREPRSGVEAPRRTPRLVAVPPAWRASASAAARRAAHRRPVRPRRARAACAATRPGRASTTCPATARCAWRCRVVHTFGDALRPRSDLAGPRRRRRAGRPRGPPRPPPRRARGARDGGREPGRVARIACSRRLGGYTPQSLIVIFRHARRAFLTRVTHS